ncbi:MAG TPA: PAS domain-containing protein, partial [Longimicrobium sp.]|nr:PAS domain-containing protein [Longimicrobium sp.]
MHGFPPPHTEPLASTPVRVLLAGGTALAACAAELLAQAADVHARLSADPAEAATLLAAGDWDAVLVECAPGVVSVARAAGWDGPLLLLAEARGPGTAQAVIETGAVDVLWSHELTPGLLERAVRYAVDRHRREAEQGESRRTLEALLANLPGMAYRCRNDARWTMEFASPGSTAITGYTPEELVGNARVAYGDLVHPEDRGTIRAAV